MKNLEVRAMTKRAVSRIWLIVLAGVLAFVPMVAAQATSKPRPKDVTVTGTVTCSKYVYSKPKRKGFTAEAIHLHGYSYVIVAGKDVYDIYMAEGHKNQLAKLAGEKVTVTGHADTARPVATTYAYQGPFETTTIVPSAK
jgi:hypothetical protein